MNTQRSIIGICLLLLLAAGCDDTVTGPTVPGFESERSAAMLTGTVTTPDGTPVFNASVHILLSFSPDVMREFVDARRPMPSTSIRFTIPTEQTVTIRLFRLGSRECISTLVSGRFAAGTYNRIIDMGDIAEGMYVYQIQTEVSITERLMILQYPDLSWTVAATPITRTDGWGKFSLPVSVFGLREKILSTSETGSEIGYISVDSVAIVLSSPGRSPSVTWMHLTDTRNTDATFILP